jgi:acetyltransferase-like isoleucine patch superfamily enzyme
MTRLARWIRHLRKLFLTLLMQLSPVPILGGLSLRLAGALSGPYKDRRVLAQLTHRSYISPGAQIRCSLQLGQSCFIDDGVTIYAHTDGGKVVLGDRVHLYRGTIIETGAGGTVVIGDDTHIQSGCNLKGFLRSTLIGRNAQVAPHCCFSPYEHEFEDTSVPIQSQGIRSKGDIVLEDDVCQGAVVGAGAVVTGDIPPYGVAVGVPARVIRIRGKA